VKLTKSYIDPRKSENFLFEKLPVDFIVNVYFVYLMYNLVYLCINYLYILLFVLSRCEFLQRSSVRFLCFWYNLWKDSAKASLICTYSDQSVNLFSTACSYDTE